MENDAAKKKGLRDVAFIGIFDVRGDPIYSLNYTDAPARELHACAVADNGSISMYKEQVLFSHREEELICVLLTEKSSNEVFVKWAFDAFVESLSGILKQWTAARAFTKYDQMVLLMNEFVFHGVILCDQPKELSKRVMKRTFESTAGIAVNKGFASFLNRTTKSFRGMH